jgi:hypothetical protein
MAGRIRRIVGLLLPGPAATAHFNEQEHMDSMELSRRIYNSNYLNDMNGCRSVGTSSCVCLADVRLRRRASEQVQAANDMSHRMQWASTTNLTTISLNHHLSLLRWYYRLVPSSQRGTTRFRAHKNVMPQPHYIKPL